LRNVPGLALVHCMTILTSTAAVAAPFDTSATLEVMRRACDYNLGLQNADQATSKSDANYEWVRGAFYTGVMGLYEATGDEKYLHAAMDYSTRRNWQLDKPETRHADWQCIGQTYLELFFLKRDPQMFAASQKNFDLQMSNPKPGREDWWWCDALYMAPPVLARMYHATGEQKYLDYLHAMYWDAYDFMYDEDESLWYRDKNYFDKKSKNGKKVFWSRGNGWVHAGLARLIPYLAKDDSNRPRYEKLFREMSNRLAEIQPADGLWRPSLLDPDDFATSETSGSAFFTFGLAWGINHGLLDRAKFEPVVAKSWPALMQAITPEGKLGYVQKVAAAPGPVNADDTREYAVGAFLLAGKEMLRLNGHPPKVEIVDIAAQERP